jgi:energy-coupling factor transporter ATP-binding protein EcfA2
MGQGLSYKDAAALLGKWDHPLIEALNRTVGGFLLGAAPLAPDVLRWFGAKNEFIKLSTELSDKLLDRRQRLSRFERTQRIEAAHTVIVFASFYDAFTDFELPQPIASVHLTRDEQIRIATRDPKEPENALRQLLDTAVYPPSIFRSFEQNAKQIETHYTSWATTLRVFFRKLAVWDELQEREIIQIEHVLKIELPKSAMERYRSNYLQLAKDCPEFKAWSDIVAQGAIHQEIDGVSLALHSLRSTLQSFIEEVSERTSDSLTATNLSHLKEPILELDEAYNDFRAPLLKDAYIEPRYRFGVIGQDSSVSDSLASFIKGRDALHSFFTAYFTSSDSLSGPLAILGQPGAGKSTLAKMIAAQLPSDQYITVRIPLRSISAQLSVQEKVESAVLLQTGERIAWPNFREAYPDRTAVVIFDGYDELIQATGSDNSNLINELIEFQQRELLLGRPTCVLVTSRVAFAARLAHRSAVNALALEPFTDLEIRQWVREWNRDNQPFFAARGINPLRTEDLLRMQNMAEQPLMLAMLSVYDLDDNALSSRLSALGGQASIIEALLYDFCAREIIKENPQMDPTKLPERSLRELDLLSVAAIGMLSRGSLWISAQDFQTDLFDLGFVPDMTRADLNRSLSDRVSESELAIGRFYFVYAASAIDIGGEKSSYEFLHSVLGEYLVTHLIKRVLGLNEHRAVEPLPKVLSEAGIDTLISWVPISMQSAVIPLLREAGGQLGVEETSRAAATLMQRWRALSDVGAIIDSGYAPTRQSITRRRAMLSVNLVLLTLALTGSISSELLFPHIDDPVDPWRSEVLIWKSQLTPSEWQSVVDLLYLERTWQDGCRAFSLSFHDQSKEPTKPDAGWVLGLSRKVLVNDGWTLRPYPRKGDFDDRERNLLCDRHLDLVAAEYTYEPPD